LFAESCFDDQFYETSNTHWAYDDYAAGNAPPRGKKHTGTRMKVLRRGRSNAVDQLLDWLVRGLFSMADWGADEKSRNKVLSRRCVRIYFVRYKSASSKILIIPPM
jgi:hypothetical protein